MVVVQQQYMVQKGAGRAVNCLSNTLDNLLSRVHSGKVVVAELLVAAQTPGHTITLVGFPQPNVVAPALRVLLPRRFLSIGLADKDMVRDEVNLASTIMRACVGKPPASADQSAV